MGLGRFLLLAGIVIALAGVLVMALERLHPPLGRLPGDFVWRGRNTAFYFPFVTCLTISALGSVVLWLMSRGR